MRATPRVKRRKDNQDTVARSDAAAWAGRQVTVDAPAHCLSGRDLVKIEVYWASGPKDKTPYVLPKTMSHGGKPNPVAYRIAGMLGQHVGEDQLRRRARTIQDLLRAAGPLIGIAASAGASIYAGLKGIFGW